MTLVFHGQERAVEARFCDAADGTPIANMFRDPNVHSVMIGFESGGGVTYTRAEIS